MIFVKFKNKTDTKIIAEMYKIKNGLYCNRCEEHLYIPIDKLLNFSLTQDESEMPVIVVRKRLSPFEQNKLRQSVNMIQVNGEGFIMSIYDFSNRKVKHTCSDLVVSCGGCGSCGA